MSCGNHCQVTSLKLTGTLDSRILQALAVASSLSSLSNKLELDT